MNSDIERDLLAQIAEARSGQPREGVAGPAALDERVSNAEFESELSAVFGDSFLPLARESELSEPGSARAEEIAGYQILLVRDSAGRLRAFRNVCPHRGAVIVRCKRATLTKLTCPYHGFTFGLDGSLKSVPDRGSFGEALDGVGLQELELATALGWCWVRPNPAESSLEGFLGTRLVDDLGNWELETADRKYEESGECEFNWKIGVEAFLESLHLPTIHGRSAHPLIDYSATAFDRFGSHSMMATPFRAENSYTTDGPMGDAAEQAGVSNYAKLNRLQLTSNLSYLIFPNTILSFLPNHFTLFSLAPLSERRSRFTWEIYGAQAETAQAKAYYDSMRAGYAQLVREDLANLEWIDKGVRDPGRAASILSRHEVRIRAFREAIAERTR